MPPLPPWEGAHPILVHFPLALLFVAPLLVLLSLLRPSLRRGMAAAALLVMALGAAGAVAAGQAGEAAAEAAERTPEGRAAEDLVEEHEEAAERAQVAFAVLTLLYAGLVLGPGLAKRELPRRADLGLHALFLALYGAAALQLAAAGHLGGRLVHEKGVRAAIGGAPAAPEDGHRRGRGR